MARSPYAIRKGFEYQDLYCCCSLLAELETGNLDTEFEIESDEAEHVDDLVIFHDPDSVVATQVKYHVDQDYVESFETLTKRRTSRSESVLEKLYRGWKSLREMGKDNVRIEFVSSNPAERGRYKLGPAIETATGRFKDKLYGHKDYADPLAKFKSLLNVENDELRCFLADVEWRFSYQSIVAFRRLAATSLKRLKLPADEDAVSRLLETITDIATSNCGRLTLRMLITKLWAISRFRDACEQQFSSIDFGTTQQRRANTVKIAVVALSSLPAMSGSRYACTEEPYPFPDYRLGITTNDREGLLNRNRASWKQEYVEWLSQRVSYILSAIPAADIDILVFPRFSLPLQVASQVAEWGRTNRVHCVVGGHSLPDSEKERTCYKTDLNLAVTRADADVLAASDLVIDAVIRFDRVGRLSISQLDSPFSKTETVIRPVDSVALETSDGWINAVLLPSRAIAAEYISRAPTRPELLIISTGIHVSDIHDQVVSSTTLDGVPIVVASADINSHPAAILADSQAPPPAHGDAWEGVRVFSITYDRSHLGWEARIDNSLSLPMVYRRDDLTLDPDLFETLRGSPASRSEAITRLQHGESKPAILCPVESAAEFFFRRANEAQVAIRDQLRNASPEVIEALAKTLEAIGASLEQLRREAFLPIEYCAPPQRLLPTRSSRFIDRTQEKVEASRWLSPTSQKAVLLIHGAPGIGKRSLLTEVQRVQPDRTHWVRFRCMPNSRLVEIAAQLLVRLGVNDFVPSELEHAVFRRIAEAAAELGTTVIVLEDSHHLPISREHEDHPAFLEMLAFFCSDTRSQPKLVLVSDWRGHLQFSGSHRMERIPVEKLDDEHITELLQEHLAETPCRFEQPSVDDLRSLTTKLHGHPFMAQLAAVVLEERTVAEVTEKLYSHVETRKFVLGRLLTGIPLSDKEQRILEFASVLRLPVSSEAFLRFGGPSCLALLEELSNRFLFVIEGSLYQLHPVLREYFSAGIDDTDAFRRLHSLGFDYYASLARRRSLTVEERTEYVYHGVSAGKPLDLADMQIFAGSIRSALDDAVRNRDWGAVESAASQLLAVWPYDVTGHIAMALALDASGRENEAGNYTAALDQVTPETIWIALEFVKSLIRRRDYEGAERNLAVIQQRYADQPRVILAEAQLCERRGETHKAVDCCERIIGQSSVLEGDAFLAALILRDANRLDLLVTHLATRYESMGFRNDGLLRMYSLATVITNHDPQEGLQVLSEMWQAAPKDGFVVSDYAAALAVAGRSTDAKLVLDRGLDDVPSRSRGYRSLLETYARLLEQQQQFAPAFQKYRDAIRVAPNHLHLYRQFARCLLDAAAAYHSQRMSAQEDSAISEAKQVLGKLLQLAPLDSWAAEAMHKAESRAY